VPGAGGRQNRDQSGLAKKGVEVLERRTISPSKKRRPIAKFPRPQARKEPLAQRLHYRRSRKCIHFGKIQNDLREGALTAPSGKEGPDRNVKDSAKV